MKAARDMQTYVLSEFGKGDFLLQNETNGIPYKMNSVKKLEMRIVFNPAPITNGVFGYPLDLSFFGFMTTITIRILILISFCKKVNQIRI
jgi:hypothetical protein